MGKYIAFLRGINVGGKNKVSMPELKALFEQNGFTDVSTYINSGNIIFSTENTDEKGIKEACEMFIRQSLHLNISVAVLSAGELKAALAHAPLWWGEDENSKHNAFLIVPPVTVAEVFKEVGTIKPDYEKVDYYGNVVFWVRANRDILENPVVKGGWIVFIWQHNDSKCEHDAETGTDGGIRLHKLFYLNQRPGGTA